MWQDIVAWLDAQCIFNLESVFRYTSIHNFTLRPLYLLEPRDHHHEKNIPNVLHQIISLSPISRLLLRYGITRRRSQWRGPQVHIPILRVQPRVPGGWDGGPDIFGDIIRTHGELWSGYPRRCTCARADDTGPVQGECLFSVTLKNADCSVFMYLCWCRWYWTCTRCMSIFSYFVNFVKCWLFRFYAWVMRAWWKEKFS